MEIKTEVKTYRVEMQCDKCVQGVMLHTNPYMGEQNIEHKCSNCGVIAFYNKQYPYTTTI